MTVHLLRPAVGIEDVTHLVEVMRLRQDSGPPPSVFITTRNTPKRASDLCDGGSVYWIIKGAIRARQAVLKVERIEGEDGRPFCRIYLAPEVFLTAPWPRRAHQGWRYLDVSDAPPDVKEGDSEDLPPEMQAELRELGLL